MIIATLLMAVALGSSPTTISVKVDQVQREALVYVPEKMEQPVPVVFGFHGHGGNMRNAASSFRIHEHWPDALVVYMQGLPTPGRLTDPEGKRNGWQHSDGDQGDRDLKFFDELLKELKVKYKVNDKSIYAMGHSNGAGFTYLLWLKRPDIFSGFAPCAAVCREATQLKPKPAMHIAGKSDPLVRLAWQERNMTVIRRTLAVEGEPSNWQKVGKKYQTASGAPWIEVIHDGDHKYPEFAGELTVSFFQELAAQAAQTPQSPSLSSTKKLPWDLEQLSVVPKWSPTDIAPETDVQAIFFEGVPYHGKSTRVFAYYGVPKTVEGEANKKVPAMVLIHGGGGTAFARWVKVWNERGYAAIAMDVCGCVPEGSYGNWKRDEQGGPPGWDASFDQLDEATHDQWTYHAVANSILAHSLLRSLPEVDAERIGVTGISWGGYLTSIVGSVDHRFRFAVPVYGCGFLGDNSAWLPRFEKLGEEKAQLWLKQWDPANYLPQASVPFLWVNGTNDFAYPMDSWQKSYRLPSSPQNLCLRIRMPHGHGPAGENPEEIRVFADQLLQGRPALPRIVNAKIVGNQLMVTYASEVEIVKAEFSYTAEKGAWQDRKWEAVEVQINAAEKTVVCDIPATATVFYLNLFDNRQCVVSTEHFER
jgi:poly(3-hydroxybutyrate) depolymerase